MVKKLNKLAILANNRREISWNLFFLAKGGGLFKLNFTANLCSLQKSKAYYGYISGAKPNKKKEKRSSLKSDSKVRNTKLQKAALFTL